MDQQLDLYKHRKVSNSSGMTRWPLALPDDLKPDVFLRVDYSNNRFVFYLNGPAIRSAEGYEEGSSFRSPTIVFPIVEDCRKQWIDHVIMRRSQGLNSQFQFPFSERWDFSSEK